jgi:hypothetical protein
MAMPPLTAQGYPSCGATESHWDFRSRPVQWRCEVWGKAMKRRASIGIALLGLSAFGFTNPPPALAQAGSIGGTIGKQDKSISGSEQAPRAASHPNRPAAKTQQASSGHSCGRIVGRWSWYLGISESVFHKDGTALHPASGTAGKWTCAGDTVNVVWGGGGAARTDRITVSQDGNGIFVDSPWGGGIKFTGSRRGQD